MKKRRRRTTWRLKIGTVRMQKNLISSTLTPVFPRHMLWVLTKDSSKSDLFSVDVRLLYCWPTRLECTVWLLSWPHSFQLAGSPVDLVLKVLCFTVSSLPAVPGFRHGGVSRSYGARWRQLSDHPCAAPHGRDAGAGPDTAAAALQAAGGQHDAQRHPEGPHVRCARTQVAGGPSVVYALGVLACFLLWQQ